MPDLLIIATKTFMVMPSTPGGGVSNDNKSGSSCVARRAGFEFGSDGDFSSLPGLLVSEEWVPLASRLTTCRAFTAPDGRSDGSMLSGRSHYRIQCHNRIGVVARGMITARVPSPEGRLDHAHMDFAAACPSLQVVHRRPVLPAVRYTATRS